jgi:hypothetical protein
VNGHRRSSTAVTRPLLLALLALGMVAAAFPAAAQEGEWQDTLVASGLEGPVDIVFGPDGTLYYAELDSGKIRAIPPGASAPLPDALAKVNSVRSENGGFLGLALDPDFATTKAFFVYYSMEKAGAKNGQVNRVSRIDSAGEKVLLDDIPYFERHNGGRLVFTGPDTLVVVTGDNELRAPAQDPKSLLGKSLRMTREGKPAPDNPDPTSLMYTLGHRNPFGLAWDAENKVLWETENGPAADDEVNILVAGGNYGWPERQGITGSKSFVEPVADYDKTIGPTGGTVLDGDFYFGAVNDGTVRRIHKEADGSYTKSEIWDGVVVLDVEAHEGRLYVAAFSDIRVLTPPGMTPPSTPPPVTPSVPLASTPGASPSTPTGAGVVTPPTESSGAPEGKADIPAPGVVLAVGVAVGLALWRREQA